MTEWLVIIVGTSRSLLRDRRELAFGNLALWHQLAARKHRPSMRRCRANPLRGAPRIQGRAVEAEDHDVRSHRFQVHDQALWTAASYLAEVSRYLLRLISLLSRRPAYG